MPTAISNTTNTTTSSNLIVTAYDKYVEMPLRSEPMFRAWVDKHPVDPSSNSNSVVLSIHADFAQATGTLTETSVPDSVAMANPTRVTVTLNEYGNWANETLKLGETAFSAVNPALANQIAYNAQDSLDAVLQTVMAASTQKYVRATASSAGLNSFDGVQTSAPNINTTTNAGTITSGDVRTIVANMRQNKVLPRVGGTYLVAIHPMVSADLQSETGSGGWNPAHVYNEGGVSNLWAGVVGQYLGGTFVETPRLTSAQSGSGTGATQYRVFNSYFLGQQALAEAAAIAPHVVLGEVTDPLKRFAPIGWHAYLGWAIYRPEAICLYQSGSATRPQL